MAAVKNLCGTVDPRLPSKCELPAPHHQRKSSRERTAAFFEGSIRDDPRILCGGGGVSGRFVTNGWGGGLMTAPGIGQRRRLRGSRQFFVADASIVDEGGGEGGVHSGDWPPRVVRTGPSRTREHVFSDSRSSRGDEGRLTESTLLLVRGRGRGINLLGRRATSGRECRASSSLEPMAYG